MDDVIIPKKIVLMGDAMGPVPNIDWLLDESKAPSYRFISYARFPATEVIVDSTVVAGVTVLEELAASIGVLEATKRCTEVTN